jgi:hypothetical protein
LHTPSYVARAIFTSNQRRCCGPTAGAVPVILVQFQLNDAHKGGKENARRAEFGRRSLLTTPTCTPGLSSARASHLQPRERGPRQQPLRRAESRPSRTIRSQLAPSSLCTLQFPQCRQRKESSTLRKWGLDGQPAVAQHFN